MAISSGIYGKEGPDAGFGGVAYIYICIYTHFYMYISARICAHLKIHIKISRYTCVQIYMCTYTHISAHVTYIHIQVAYVDIYA